MLAIYLGLLTGLCFGASSMFAQKGLRGRPEPWGVWITLLINTVMLSAAHLVIHPSAPILVFPNLIFVLIGLFVPGITRILSFRGIRTMGSSMTSTVINSTPMFSAALAMLFLGERPGMVVLAGAALIVAGLMTISWVEKKGTWKRTEMTYPLMAALLYGTRDVLTRYGVTASGEPVLGAAITATTATLEIYLIIRIFQRKKFAWPSREQTFWFALSGLSTSGAFFFMFLAFHLERVTVVAPMINSYSVFVLFLAPLVIGRAEALTTRKISGTLTVVAGVFLIAAGRN